MATPMDRVTPESKTPFADAHSATLNVLALLDPLGILRDRLAVAAECEHFIAEAQARHAAISADVDETTAKLVQGVQAVEVAEVAAAAKLEALRVRVAEAETQATRAVAAVRAKRDTTIAQYDLEVANSKTTRDERVREYADEIRAVRLETDDAKAKHRQAVDAYEAYVTGLPKVTR